VFLSSSGRRSDLTNIEGEQIPRPRGMPRLAVDTHEILSRFAAAWRAHHEEAGHAESLEWQDAVPVIPALCAEVDFRYQLLADERRRYADLLAAVHAALGAARDGEPDPLAYLRDDLPENRGRYR
jgi:hypothetical protein